MKIYEMFGRQAEGMQELREFHTLTMQLLRDLKTGTVDISQVILTENGWQIEARKAVAEEEAPE